MGLFQFRKILDSKWPESEKTGLGVPFEDTRMTQTDNVAPSFDEYLVTPTFYVIPDQY